MSQGRYVCQAYGGMFPGHAIKPNQRDDYPCPAWGSLQLERIESWLDKLCVLLTGYNRV